MGKLKYTQNNDNKKVKVTSIGDYKAKVQEKEKQIKEFEEGPQPISGCTCGEHTDPNQFLTEKQVTKHFLKDRKRYVEGLKGEDALEIYMETFKNLMNDAPLVRLNMETQQAMMEHISNHFNEGMKFYEQYIKYEQDLTSEAETIAKELKIGYEEYKEYVVKSLINSYIIDKRKFNSEHSTFARKKGESLTNEDSLDISINETKGYIEYMEDHFRSADMQVKQHILSTAAQNLEQQINNKLNGKHISGWEIVTLGNQMQRSLKTIKQTIAHNRQRDFEYIQEKYNNEKDNCSIEYKAKTLIELELRKREINGNKHTEKSEFTINSSMKQLTEALGMENIICKLLTKELETLFEQFKTVED